MRRPWSLPSYNPPFCWDPPGRDITSLLRHPTVEQTKSRTTCGHTLSRPHLPTRPQGAQLVPVFWFRSYPMNSIESTVRLVGLTPSSRGLASTLRPTWRKKFYHLSLQERLSDIALVRVIQPLATRIPQNDMTSSWPERTIPGSTSG